MSEGEPSKPSREDQLKQLLIRVADAIRAGKSDELHGLIQEHPEFAAELSELAKSYSRTPDATGEPEAAEEDLPRTTAIFVPTASKEDTHSPSSESDTTKAPGKQASEDSPSIQSIKRIGQYNIEREIGRGGMGVVYEATQQNLKRPVAIKLILAGRFASKAEIQRFRSEAENAGQLDHPGIVPILEFGQEEGIHFISMAYVDGKNLAAIVADHSLEPRAAAGLLLSVSRAVAFAHQKGIIHRDLKPSNIIIDQNGAPRITDFGLSKRMDAERSFTTTGQIFGTPGYVSPEQVSGKRDEVGPKSDVYSLGAILYFLLTGRPPFQAANPVDALFRVLESDPIPPRQFDSRIPRELESVCLKCLNRDSQLRYDSANDLSEDLGRFLRNVPTNAGGFHSRLRLTPIQFRIAAFVALVYLILGVYTLAFDRLIDFSAPAIAALKLTGISTSCAILFGAMVGILKKRRRLEYMVYSALVTFVPAQIAFAFLAMMVLAATSRGVSIEAGDALKSERLIFTTGAVTIGLLGGYFGTEVGRVSRRSKREGNRRMRFEVITPGSVATGEKFSILFVFENLGRKVISGVSYHVELPEELNPDPSKGPNLTCEIGAIGPGEQDQMKFNTCADSEGELNISCTVTGNGRRLARTKKRITVSSP